MNGPASVDVGFWHTCALLEDGDGYCWGENWGALGIGVVDTVRANPVRVMLVAGGGPCHGETCGITIHGTVLCWGKNYQRQIGPNHDISWTEPTAIQEDPGWVDVFIGPNMVCGHDSDGDLHCIGDAEYGIKGYTQNPEPLVPELEAASIVQGQTHACILTPEGEAHCWGSNSYGQLGSQSQSIGWTSPVPVWAPPGG